VTLTANKLANENAQDANTWLENIFQEHWPRVYGLLFRLVGDRAEAEDLALEAFWRLHRHNQPFNRDHNLSGWLYRVATNLGYNALRSRRRRMRYEEEAGQQALDFNTALDPQIEIERAENRLKVRQALSQMKPRSAELLVLRHSGLTYAEVAETLGIAPGSVGTLLARAEKEFIERYLE
jgi:RNA polymerase sigma-70 factor (ECF subfamily)